MFSDLLYAPVQKCLPNPERGLENRCNFDDKKSCPIN